MKMFTNDCATRQRSFPQYTGGFTLIELLIAMTIGGIVMAAVVQLFATEVKTHNAQFAISSLQQNMRSSMDYMTRYIRMAAFDPSSTGAGFQSTLANRLDFTCDIGTLDDASTANDTTPNGSIDNNWDEHVIFKLTGDRLEREDTSGAGRLVAENIEALNFRYLDKNGADTTNADDVRSVQITMVGRTSPNAGLMPKYVNTTIFQNQRGDTLLPAQNDSARRMMLTAEVRCRNLNR